MVNWSIYTRNLRNLVISFLAFDPAMKALFKSLPIPISLLIAILCSYTNAANFEIRNNCPYTVWAASVPIGGGRQLNSGEIWNISVPANTMGRIWGRTNCTFDRAGRGRCETGDCNGTLECNSFGAPPNTMAEYALNQFGNQDFFDISLVNGFNVPMDFTPVDFNPSSNECNLVEYTGSQYIGKNLYISLDDGVNGQMQVSSSSDRCARGSRCAVDINGVCPVELQAPGGCNNPCTVFKTDLYCCTGTKCQATYLSTFFKEKCPDAYSYSMDDQTSTFTCPGGTNYRVVFCP